MASAEPDREAPTSRLPDPTASPGWRDLFDFWGERTRRPDLWRLVATSIGLAVVVAGGAYVAFARAGGSPAEPPPESLLPTASVALLEADPLPVTDTRVAVHVAGAVHAPGLVELAEPGRVADAIAAAGGMLADADADRLNLAAPVADGQRVYVPLVGEAAVPAIDAGDGGSGSGPLNLNTATGAQLEGLPGVGPATAAAIVAWRDEHGPFASVNALDDVPGIGPAKLQALFDLVTVGSP